MLSGMAFHAANTHRVTSEGAAQKGRLKERCGLEPRTNFFSFKKSAETSRLDSRIYGILLLSILLIFIKLTDDAQQNLLDQQSGYFILQIFNVCLDVLCFCYVHISE